METLRFVDLFAGIGGFHRALSGLRHECVYAVEIEPHLRDLYLENFPDMRGKIHDDVRTAKDVPDHDILCAGFPCQAFSKSGKQHGRREIRGAVVDEFLRIVREKKPQYVILENVGNFERHADGENWQRVKRRLNRNGYVVRATTHVSSGGNGLLSPHHLGFAHHRERFYAVASRGELPEDPFPPRNRQADTSKNWREIVQPRSALTDRERTETALTKRQTDCINHWNRFLGAIPGDVQLPSFPIWGEEMWSKYPYANKTPHAHTIQQLREKLGLRMVPLGVARKDAILKKLPSYAREKGQIFPPWKVAFLRQNREWLASVKQYLPAGWEQKLRAEFPSSLQKLEWNCQGEERDLWKTLLQFRPSGLRAKKYSSSPALVAMTATQIPILGPQRRFLTELEGKFIQGLPKDHKLPEGRSAAFHALGNAVHVGVVREVARRLVAGIESDVSSAAASQEDGEPLGIELLA